MDVELSAAPRLPRQGDRSPDDVRALEAQVERTAALALLAAGLAERMRARGGASPTLAANLARLQRAVAVSQERLQQLAS